MIVNIELNEADLKRLVAAEIAERTGQEISQDDIELKVKSKQNYKAEWENAAFRATYYKSI